MNRENMEKWVEALETYKGERAHCTLLDHEGNLCAMGIGLRAAGLLRTVVLGDTAIPHVTEDEESAFYAWIGHEGFPDSKLDLPLKPDASTLTVTQANDLAKQDAWTIAQRLRETYLKEES